MKKFEAESIHKLVRQQGGRYREEDSIPSGLVKKFHQWADGKKSVGGLLLRDQDGQSFWVVFIEWNPENRKNGYYLVLFPANRSGPIAEIHELRKGSLFWRYRPAKQDTKNRDRKEYFERYFLSLDVRIAIPLEPADVDPFLTELFSLADSRLKADQLSSDTPEFRDGFPEGKVKERLHKARERNSALTKAAKEAALRDGHIFCQACGFDFEQVYGKLGRGFIEAHHTMPISDLEESGGETKLEDIALVCSNCHSMLHRRRPWLGMNELRKLLK